mgnify:CR=1 FL=1
MHTLSNNLLEEFVAAIEPTGSRVICNPAPTDTDEDWLVLLRPDISLKFFEQQMKFEGYDGSSELYDLDETIFCSLRKEEENLIATNNQEFFDKMVLATAVAKQLNVLEKHNRIMLFNAIVRGESPKKKQNIFKSWFEEQVQFNYNDPQGSEPQVVLGTS